MTTIQVKDQDVRVDDSDRDEIASYRWSITNGYASRSGWPEQKTIYMHRQIMDAPKGMVVDHINHDKLDNRRENLRIVSHRTNGLNRKNRTFLPGVHKLPARKLRFRASINLGYFQTEEEAHLAWVDGYVRLFGEKPSLASDAVTLLLQQEKGDLPVG